MLFVCLLLTCTEPGSVRGQNCVDLEAAVCWLNWDWRNPQMSWVPADKEISNEVKTWSHHRRNSTFIKLCAGDTSNNPITHHHHLGLKLPEERLYLKA